MLLREGEEVEEEDDERDNGTMSGKWTVGILTGQREYRRETAARRETERTRSATHYQYTK